MVQQSAGRRRSITEVIMILKLLLELLAVVPATTDDLLGIVQELHGSDPTAQKVANIATAAAKIAEHASAVVAGASNEG